MAGHPELGDAAVKMQYALMPKKKGKVDIDTLRDIHDWKLTTQDDLLEIMHQDGEGVSLMPYYLIEYLDGNGNDTIEDGENLAKILIVEDEKSISDELVILLQNAGYNTAVIKNFEDTEAQIQRTMPDLILLDIGLPGQDGYRICTELRKTSQIPVIFVTSRNTSMDELKALSLGGDDFISKPYDLPVLLARIQALLRRSGQTAKDTLTVNGLTLSLPKGEIEHDGQRADITKNEAKILSCLMKTPGKIVSRPDLIEYLWNNQVYIDDNTLSVNVTRLRGKLNNIGLPDYVKTKRGLGYKI